jgi:hypothetical protein
VTKIVGRDRKKLKELQTDATGYILAGVIWRSNNEARRTWWFLLCPLLKMLLYGVDMMFRKLTYDKGKIWLRVMQLEIV